jgi:hypothetical protein
LASNPKKRSQRSEFVYCVAGERQKSTRIVAQLHIA